MVDGLWHDLRLWAGTLSGGGEAGRRNDWEVSARIRLPGWDKRLLNHRDAEIEVFDPPQEESAVGGTRRRVVQTLIDTDLHGLPWPDERRS